MTLHWWMHWFWVTALLIIIESSGQISAAPQSQDFEVTTDLPAEPLKPSDRQAKAMYFPKTPAPTTRSLNTTTPTTKEPEEPVANVTNDDTTETSHPIQWVPTNTSEIINTTTVPPTTNKTIASHNVTSDNNVTETQNATFASKKRNLTTLDFVKDDTSLEGLSESRIVTGKPLTHETTFLQTRIPDSNVESSPRIKDPGGREGDMDMGAIAGISFAALVLAALAGSTAFVLYRRRYLNKPQTLNDKCSNPDSSGYLDDSTIRDNSEEMYSLDNDSFLNSLEAMTIQNYWTDTVKHTKL